VATSGSYTFDPTFAGCLSEALEQAGIDPASASERHINSAKMSLNLMFTAWAAIDGDALYRVASTTATLLAADYDFNLTTGAFDVVDMTYTYGGLTDNLKIKRISRQDWVNIVDRTQTGSPSHFYVDQSVLNAPKVLVWPIPDATCVFSYDYMRFVESVTGLAQTFDVQRLWLDAVTSELALRLARKFNVPRVPLLTPIAREAYKIARRAGSGGSQVRISGRAFGRGGRTVRG
jgi:hypothetical protein